MGHLYAELCKAVGAGVGADLQHVKEMLAELLPSELNSAVTDSFLTYIFRRWLRREQHNFSLSPLRYSVRRIVNHDGLAGFSASISNQKDATEFPWKLTLYVNDGSLVQELSYAELGEIATAFKPVKTFRQTRDEPSGQWSRSITFSAKTLEDLLAGFNKPLDKDLRIDHALYKSPSLGR